MPTALKATCVHFQRYPNVGALTGELKVQRPYRTFLTSVQFCEWKVSHLLQKPIESVCGFLTVLPGAFSAFRWLAVEVGGRQRSEPALAAALAAACYGRCARLYHREQLETNYRHATQS